MSTLPLKMLLCERETEKTDFEVIPIPFHMAQFHSGMSPFHSIWLSLILACPHSIPTILMYPHSIPQDKYLQLELLKTPGHGNETGRAQQLMKLFAVRQ